VTNTAIEAAGPQTETFATPAGRILGYVVVGVAIIMVLLALRAQGTGAIGPIGLCVALAALSWVTLIRPRVTAHTNGLLLRNMLRDTFVPWASIKSCRVAQTLQIGTRDRVYHGLGVTKSARQATREQRRRFNPKSRRMTFGPNFGMGSLASAPEVAMDEGHDAHRVKQEQEGANYFTHTEQRIETLAQKNATATADFQPKIVWDPLAIGGVVLACLGVVLAILV
jgi:PH (Pleckstrin Homology) domain-containing protein